MPDNKHQYKFNQFNIPENVKTGNVHFRRDPVTGDYDDEIPRYRDYVRANSNVAGALQTMTAPRLKVWRKTNGFCFFCGKNLRPFKISPHGQGDHFNISRIVPKKLGGKTGLKNTVPSCPKCTATKSTRTISQFRAELRSRQYKPIYFTPEQKSWLISKGFNYDEHCRAEIVKLPRVVFWAEVNGWELTNEGVTK